ncbi:MAG: glycosyltransferase [Bacteroidales bacterium]|nr:glycosyltransferase [Bacteroidales bacterium]
MSNGKTKRVLIITYYWPPSGGAPVQRWLKFAKYLERFGWQPVIYTPENPESFYDDESLMRDVPKDIEIVKSHIWEPYDIYRMLTGKKGEKIAVGFTSADKKKGVSHNLLMWLRGNLLIPDPRIFWVNPSVRFLKKYLKENPVDVVVTTGPPHSLHLIGLKLKRKLKVKWLADFRDPWTNIYYIDDLKLGKIAKSIHSRLERKVVSCADIVTVVSRGMKNYFESVGASNIEILTNGFDREDWKRCDITQDKSFTITHVGTLTPFSNPVSVWQALSELCKSNATFNSSLVIRLVGHVDSKVLEYIKQCGLIDKTVIVGQVTHDDALKYQLRSQVLLLAIPNVINSEGILTGKFFEYMAANRKILAVGSKRSDLIKILKDTRVGDLVEYDNVAETKGIIENYFEFYLLNQLNSNGYNAEVYSRVEITRKLANILDKML